MTRDITPHHARAGIPTTGRLTVDSRSRCHGLHLPVPHRPVEPRGEERADVGRVLVQSQLNLAPSFTVADRTTALFWGDPAQTAAVRTAASWACRHAMEGGEEP
jgi:hypothetical protein